MSGVAKNRVLVLNQFALPRSSPGGTRHVELFGKLQGWRPTLLVGNRSMLNQAPIKPSGFLKTVPVTPYKGNGFTRIVNWASYSAGAVLRGAARKPVDVVYGSSPHLGAALAGLIIARAHRAKFVLEVRDLWPQILIDARTMQESSPIYRSLKWLERFLYRKADAIVVLAKGSIDAIAAEGVNRSKIRFLPNGADPDDFVVRRSRQKLRDEFEFAGTVIVYAGAHGPANGLDLALDAADKLQDTDALFVFVGDGVVKQDLIADASARGLDNVEFRDPISKDSIPELFAAADIGLHCLADVALFHHGVSPNKLYDYMASGLPVITNTPGEVASMVNEAESGEAVGPNEIADGVRRIQALHGSVRSKLGESGKQWMQANRSRRALAAELESLLTEL